MSPALSWKLDNWHPSILPNANSYPSYGEALQMLEPIVVPILLGIVIIMFVLNLVGLIGGHYNNLIFLGEVKPP